MSNFNADAQTGTAAKPAHQPPPPPHVSGPSVHEQPNGGGRKNEREHWVHKAPPWIEAACAILLVMITAAYTHYASKQATAALSAANAAKDNAAAAKHQAEIAKGTLEEIQRGASDTQKMIAANTEQATATNVLAKEARRSADIAQRSFEAANRPVATVVINVKFWVRDEKGKDVLVAGPLPVYDSRGISFEIVYKNFSPLGVARNLKVEPLITVGGVELPKASPLQHSPDTMYPANTTVVKAGIVDAMYSDVTSGKSDLVVESILGYDGLGRHYTDCDKHRYDPERQVFVSMGRCSK